MDHKTSPGHVVGTLQHLFRHWEDRQKAAAEGSVVLSPSPDAWTIALSRETGSQAAAVGHEVGSRLGWPVYGHELLQRIAQDMGLHTRLLESVDEQRVGWVRETFRETFHALMSVPYASQTAYFHRLVKTVLALGSHGECVIIGRGAPFILPATRTVRVRLVAPLKDRVAIMAQRLGISLDAAARQVETLDRQRDAFVREHFARDPADPRHYDLLLNVTRVGVTGAAELIIAALGPLRAHSTPESTRQAAPRAAVGSSV
jgi:cytidylate kinase